MAIKTISELIKEFNYFDEIEKIKTLFRRIDANTLSEQGAIIAALGTTTNLTAIAATYADLAAARTSVNTLRTDVEARLDAIEAKVDVIIAALKTTGVIAE